MAALQVHLKDLGVLNGTCHDGVAQFLAVPFAAPPVGPLRWQPPRPPPPWSEARDSPSRLPCCPQPNLLRSSTFRGHTLHGTEDCLVLNVFAGESAVRKAQEGKGARKGSSLKPVVFFIHGGAGKFGHCHTLSGQALGQHVCYVAANYRLGVFGWLAHPALSAEDEALAGQAAPEDEPGDSSEPSAVTTPRRRYGARQAAAGQAAPEDAKNVLAGSGNYAMLDLIAALRWVRNHASSFGGDPSNVTIWGLSSGAQYVANLLVSPPAAGLFHRAFIQSAVDLNNVRSLRHASDVWLGRSAEEWGVEFGKATGCNAGSDSKEQIALMRALDAKVLVTHSFDDEASDCYEATIDNRRLVCSVKPLSSAQALRDEDFHRVPVILGYTEQDGLGKEELEHTMFPQSDVTDMEGYRALLSREFGAASAEAESHYPHHPSPARPASRDRHVRLALGHLSKDLWYESATWCMADFLSRAVGPPAVFLYRFSEKVSEPLGRGRVVKRSFHGSDMGFWNGTQGGALGKTMKSYLVKFAETGNPNGGGLPSWNPHVAGSGRFMDLGPELSMRERTKQAAERYSFLAREYFGGRLLTQVPLADVPEGKRRRLKE